MSRNPRIDNRRSLHIISFQRKCNQKQKKDNSIQIVNSPFLVKIKRSKLVIFKLPLSVVCLNCKPNVKKE